MSAPATTPDASVDGRVYVYAIVPGGASLPESAQLGELRLIETADVAAVVGPVTPAMAAAARIDLADGVRQATLDDLAPAVAEHEGVVSGLLEVLPAVLPLRFGSVTSGDADVVRLLEQHTEDLRTELSRVESRAEWGVKLFVRSAETSDPATPAAGPTSGRAYLEARRDERAARAATSERHRVATERIFGTVAASSAAAVAVHSDLATSSATPGLVAEAAFLVERGSGELRFLEVLEDAMAAHGGGHLLAEVAGPWPAYHFTGAAHGDTDDREARP